MMANGLFNPNNVLIVETTILGKNRINYKINRVAFLAVPICMVHVACSHNMEFEVIKVNVMIVTTRHFLLFAYEC